MTTLREAIEALGVIGNGYCFCGKDRDPDKAVHEPECRDLLAALAASEAEPQPVAQPTPNMADAAEMLWILLANVSGGDWSKQTPEWEEACIRWRDYYFAARNASPPARTPMTADMMWRIWSECIKTDNTVVDFLRRIERHHGIGGE